jgi:hypothetical protein
LERTPDRGLSELHRVCRVLLFGGGMNHPSIGLNKPSN